MSEETAAATEEKTAKGPGVGARAKDLIRDGKTNAEVLAAIKEEFPDAKTSIASINWYRNHLRSNGEDGVLTSREIKAANKPVAEEKPAKVKKAAKGKQAKEDAKSAESAAILD